MQLQMYLRPAHRPASTTNAKLVKNYAVIGKTAVDSTPGAPIEGAAVKPRTHVQKGIFVPRASTDTTADTIITNFVKRRFSVETKVSKLKTKFDWYNSFQLECDPIHYNRLLDADLWPAGPDVDPHQALRLARAQRPKHAC